VGQRAPGFGETTGVLANDFLSGFSTVGTQVVSVGGTSDPWLAGMPNGTLASFVDLAPAQSPVQVASLSFRAGDVLRFDATGNATNSHNLQVFPITGPDGGFFLHHESGAEHGISDVHAPVTSLVGVFLDRFQPNFFTPPATLDFRPGGNVPGGVNYTRLEPALRHVFFIGDGWTSGGQQQAVVVPQGSTRLFLGTMDGFEWTNNIGRFDVQVRTSGDIQIGATLEEGPSHGQIQLAPDGGFTYIPQTGFVGLDRFTYLVSNGSGETAVGSVLFQVGEVQLPGDIDSDGEVAFADFVILAEHFGQSEVTRAEGDLDGDGAVTFADFVILADNFGRQASDVDLADLSSGMASES
jgi:hypothetical protein